MNQLHIVLVEPEIPQNTGNIARTCAATGAALHLIEPLGFKIDEKAVKRAGLDYWHLLDIYTYENIEDFWDKNKEGRFYYLTTKATHNYAQVGYGGDAPVYLLFGKETKGLPESMLVAAPERCVRIPMNAMARSLNLSNAVAIVAYEALRQRDFSGLLEAGQFPM